MIPKTIHYCWFGRNPKPDLLKKCIASWSRYCPDYEMIEWNEDNFDIGMVPYVKEAYDARKWAFVTDYVRLWIIFNHGGIYLDTDVELIKSLDPLLDNHAYFGIEDTCMINTGLGFGAEKGNPAVGRMLEDYKDVHFLKDDGSYDLLTCPVRNTKSIAGLLPEVKNELTRTEDAVFYPSEYFCPLSADGRTMKKTKNTYSIHWFSATWLNEQERIVHEYRLMKNKCVRYFGKTAGGYLVRIIYLFKPRKRKILKES